MTIVLTLCSANYLAHAKTLGDSVARHNPDYHFVIGLVDRVPKQLRPDFWSPYELIPVEDLQMEAFQEMARKYNIVELNTAVKPFYMEHLYRRNPKVDSVIYMDPDIAVYSSLHPLADKLRTCNIIVTPHSCTFDDSPTNMFYEIAMLSTGIYNLGFIATTRSETTLSFLRWWRMRLRDYCYYRGGTGLFVDQIWLTLAPLYFPGIHVEKDPGCNMSYWNHFERRLSQINGMYLVNGAAPLVFYHFSSYDPNAPDLIAKRPEAQVPSFRERPDLKPIYDDYRQRLFANRYVNISSMPCCFGRKPLSRSARMKKLTRDFLREMMNTLPRGIQAPAKSAARVGRSLLKGGAATDPKGNPISLAK